MKQPIHLGDGAYVSEGCYPGEVVLTTGSHKIEEADNQVVLDPHGVRAFLLWLNRSEANGESVKE